MKVQFAKQQFRPCHDTLDARVGGWGVIRPFSNQHDMLIFCGYMLTLHFNCASCKTRTPAGCILVVTVTHGIILFIPAWQMVSFLED